MKRLFITSFAALFIVCSLATIAGAAINNTESKSIQDTSNVSDSLTVLTEDSNFQEFGIKLNHMDESVKIDKNTAIEIAKKSVGTDAAKEAKKITAVLAKYTDEENPKLLNTDISLIDYPVWIITFRGVTLQRHRAVRVINSDASAVPNIQTVYADVNVIIDANNGNELKTISYNSIVK